MEGRSRRGLSGIVAGALAAASFAGVAYAAAAWNPGAGKQAGQFALFDGSRQVLSAFWSVPPAGLAGTLKVQQFLEDGTHPLLNYGIDMGTTAHFFLVRDDFGSFKHYNAAYNTGTGTLSHDFTKEPNHAYYLYADTHPLHMHRQVFRFKIDSTGSAQPVGPSMTASAKNSAAGPYTVIFDTTTLAANQPHLLLVTIDRDGKAAQDLSPYFGGAAHMVMINASTLDYVFTHPTLRGQTLDKSMSYTIDQEIRRLSENSKVGPNQQVELPALPAGTYKVWYEFTGGVMQNTYDAPFTMTVQ
ncbi:MAG: hypothetical protein JO277_00710 [Candidatus Eremiobacteraeota bacterium]|nr:hypothetical protein [Candidatus Eremiobacteraeota bacterium]